MDEFRTSFERWHFVLIDDIQFISGKERTQAEFFSYLNPLYEARKQMSWPVINFQKIFQILNERLRSRVWMGSHADIQAPISKTKVAILRKKAGKREYPYSQWCRPSFWLPKLITNIRVLEGSLFDIGAFASLTKTSITIEMAKGGLKKYYSTQRRIYLNRFYSKTVSTFYNIKLSDLKVKRKYKGYVLPRRDRHVPLKKDDHPLLWLKLEINLEKGPLYGSSLH